MEYSKQYYEIDDYAGFLLRLVAYIIDGFIINIVSVVAMAILYGPSLIEFGELGDDPAPEEVMALMGNFATLPLIIIAGQWLYFALMESSKHQATLGKMAVGIKVTNEFGDPIGFGRATGRYFGKILSGAILMIGYLMVIFTEKKQALHDILATTLVLKRDVPPLEG